jgi:hypothetical protein
MLLMATGSPFMALEFTGTVLVTDPSPYVSVISEVYSPSAVFAGCHRDEGDWEWPWRAL